MRRVKMIFNISGGRADGRAWPNAGEPLVLDDGEAGDLVRGGMATWDEPPGWQPAPPVIPSAPPEAMVSEPSRTAAGPAVATEPVPEPPSEPEPERTEAPASYAPKGAWVSWAMAHGATEDEANMATKAQLMEQFGDRA